MNRLLLAAFVSLVVLVVGWTASDSIHPAEPTRSTHEQFLSDAPEPVLANGETLEELAIRAYGHRNFAGFLRVLNAINHQNRSTKKLAAKAPPLALVFRKASLNAQVQSAFVDLARGADEFFALLPSYRKQRTESGVSSRGTFALSTEIKAQLLKNADNIDLAVSVLRGAEPSQRPPEKSTGQLHAAAALMRVLASGALDGYGYDYDLVGQRLGFGFQYAIEWIQDSSL